MSAEAFSLRLPGFKVACFVQQVLQTFLPFQQLKHSRCAKVSRSLPAFLHAFSNFIAAEPDAVSYSSWILKLQPRSKLEMARLRLPAQAVPFGPPSLVALWAPGVWLSCGLIRCWQGFGLVHRG